MKKIFKIVLIVTVLVAVFNACGEDEKEVSRDPIVQTQEQTEAEVETKEYTEETETVLETVEETEEETETEVETEEETESIETTEEPETEKETEAPADGLRPEFKAAMDAYENFYNEYCDLLEKYYKDPTDLKLLGEYTKMMKKAVDMDEAFQAWDSKEMNNAELKYYMDVTNRVTKRMLEVTE